MANHPRTAADVFAGLGAGLAGQGAQFTELQAQRRDTDEKLRLDREKERNKTFFIDSFQMLDFANRNDFGSLAKLSQRRLQQLQQIPGVDLSDSQQINDLAQIAIGGGPGAQEAQQNLVATLQNTTNVGQAIGAISPPKGPSALDVAKTRQAEAAAAKTRAETAEIGKPKPERKISAKERAETLKIIAETKKLNRLSGAAPLSKAQEKEMEETVKSNVKRTATLSEGSTARTASVKKANKFLRGFKSGQFASGAGRAALSFVPGIFTSQGQFDEELDSFTEIAAREKLKAVGEIKPTDADVEGMKRALFGVGRDEQTNINLLQQFIDEQDALDDELDSLRECKRRGGLATFTGIRNVPVEVDF